MAKKNSNQGKRHLELAVRFDTDVQSLISHVLENAKNAVNAGILHDGGGLGALAYHLRAIAETLGIEEDFQQCADGDAIDMGVNGYLQAVPSEWHYPWDRILEIRFRVRTSSEVPA